MDSETTILKEKILSLVTEYYQKNTTLLKNLSLGERLSTMVDVIMMRKN